MERTAILTGLELRIECPRLLQCSIAVEYDPGMDLRFPVVDLFEATVEHLHAGDSAFAQCTSNPGDRLVGLGKQPGVASEGFGHEMVLGWPFRAWTRGVLGFSVFLEGTGWRPSASPA